MKSVNEMTLLEIEALLKTYESCYLKMHEIHAVHSALDDLKIIMEIICKEVKAYSPVHSCPQCASPKKEKEAPIHFSLD